MEEAGRRKIAAFRNRRRHVCVGRAFVWHGIHSVISVRVRVNDGFIVVEVLWDVCVQIRRHIAGIAHLDVGTCVGRRPFVRTGVSLLRDVRSGIAYCVLGNFRRAVVFKRVLTVFAATCDKTAQDCGSRHQKDRLFHL